MSAVLQDISYDLINGIYTVLNGITVESAPLAPAVIPVFKSIPKTPPTVYIYVGNVIQTEDGTKDEFMYYGTIQVQVVDESKERADMKLSQDILNDVRELLKPTKSATLNIGDKTLVILKHESFNSLISQADNGIARIQLIDIYSFMIT